MNEVERLRALADEQAAVLRAAEPVTRADPARGTGLTGLADRVDAARGTFVIISRPGGGTVVRAELPVDPGR